MNKVAVVIPLYNKIDTVGRTISSVRAQTLKDIEIVVVDDGSTDSPEPAVLEAFDGDERCTYVRQKNAGVAHARNNGVFKHTTAPYVLCLDSDDAIETRYLDESTPPPRTRSLFRHCLYSTVLYQTKWRVGSIAVAKRVRRRPAND